MRFLCQFQKPPFLITEGKYIESHLSLAVINNLKGHVYQMLEDIRHDTVLCEGSQALLACPSDNSSTKFKVSMKHW